MSKMPVRPLPADLAEIAKTVLYEDSERVEENLAYLKDWISKQPHLKARTDDQWLLIFLRGCKWSLERTKEKLDLYYTFRTAAPEFLTAINHRDPKFTEIQKLGITICLPNAASSTSPRIIFVRLGRYDPSKYNILDVMAVLHVQQQIAHMECDQSSVCGVEAIIDLEGMTMAHLAQMSPSVLKKMIFSSEVATVLRVKGSHYLNTPPGFETIFNLAKTFVKEKMKNRMHIYNKDFGALYKRVPKEILPQEYGGNVYTIPEIIDYWLKKYEEHRSFLDEDMSYGTDESKRPGKPMTAEDMFGVEGSFRQLKID